MMRLKRVVLAGIILFLMAFVFSGCSKRESPTTTKDIPVSYKEIPGVTHDEINAIEVLIAQRGGFTYGHTYETEAFKLPDGSFSGFTIELCKLFSELFDAEFLPRYFEGWMEMKTALDYRQLDFSGGIPRNEEHLKKYFMTISIAGRNLKAYVLKDSEIVEAEDLIGKRIGTLSGSALLEAVGERYPDFTVDAVELSSYAQGVALLQTGRIDAIIASSASDPRLSIYGNVESREIFSLAYYPFSITTADPELEPIIKVIDKYLESGGINKVFELYYEGEYEYKKNNLYQSFTDEERAYLDEMISDGKKVNIGLQHDAYPASFYNEAEQEFQGVSIDILKEINKLTGLEFEPLSTSETTTLATILEKLKNGEISMMTQLLKTESRKNDYIWSSVPYLTTNYALLSKMDFPNVEASQIPWERIGTVDKSAHEVMFTTWFPNHQRHIVYATTNEGFDALEAGEIDLLMLSENMLLQQTNLRQKTGFKTNFSFEVELDSFFGFSKDEAILCSIVDKAMEVTDLNSISNEWMNRVFDYSSKIAQMQATNMMVLTIVALLLLFALSLLLLRNRRLSSSLLQRTSILTSIYTSIPDTIFCKDAEGLYISCNPSFEKQAGMPEKDIIGKTFSEVFADRVRATADKNTEIDNKIISEGITYIIEEPAVLIDGSHVILEVLKAPLIQNGEVVGIIGMGRDVTERKEMRSHLDAIIHTAQIAFIMTVDGIVVEANKYFIDRIGLNIGDDIRQIYDKPEQRDTVLKMVEKYETVSNSVIFIKIANGEVHRFLASITSTEFEQQKAHIIWAIDIEQDERKSDLLRVTQHSFQTVLDTLPMPIRIVDLETRKIVYCNDSLLELLEYQSRDELVGTQISNIIPITLGDGRDSADLSGLILAEVPRPVSADMEYLSKTGNRIEAVVVAKNIDYKGRRSSIGIIKDLTEEKRMAQILREAAEREKEANQAKSLFLASMSHEIRTPMNGVIGMTDLLLHENLSERQLQYARDIKASAESLLSIINDILDLSKITEGKLQILPVDIDLSELLSNTISMLRFSAQKKGLRFIDDTHINCPEYVRIDDVRLNQIIINLLSNAIKFTNNGSVRLMVRIEDGNIYIEVSDTGIGIKEQDIGMIFSAFEQADKRKNRAIKGTGLGLSITKNLVELMGGEIRVESEYEHGSTFFVTLPHVPGDEAAVEPKEAVFEYIFAPTAQILLVDDIQTNLTVGAGLLRMCGIAADVAMSGREAIEYVKEREYDIVFMDHMMPEMDGVETMNEIRSMDAKYQKLPIIALTANAVNESRDLLLSSGMDDFLSKPIDKLELMNILKKWLPAEKIKSISESGKSDQNIQYSETLLALSNIEGIDIELALSRIGGLQDVLENSIRQVANSIDEKLKNMDDSLAKGDLSGFAVDAHGFKGALANIGSMRYSELAAALEIGAKAENVSLCTEKFTIFASVIGEFAVQLKEVFRQMVKKERLPGDKERLETELTRAISFLDAFEASDAVMCLNELAEYTYGEAVDGRLNEAINAAERFSYNEAIEKLRSVL